MDDNVRVMKFMTRTLSSIQTHEDLNSITTGRMKETNWISSDYMLKTVLNNNNNNNVPIISKAS